METKNVVKTVATSEPIMAIAVPQAMVAELYTCYLGLPTLRKLQVDSAVKESKISIEEATFLNLFALPFENYKAKGNAAEQEEINKAIQTLAFRRRISVEAARELFEKAV